MSETRGPRLVLLGKQGAGKGTQGDLVARRFGIQHLSTGQLFRDSAAVGVAAGLEAKDYMDRGELVPDDIVVAVVEERFANPREVENGFVLDGFPRTLHQAVELDRVLDGHPLDLTINIDVPREIVLDRLAGRRVCEDCQRVYHVNMPPTANWTCDTCGGKVVQRADDHEEAIDRRLELYERETVPIIEYYREQGLLTVVDGVGDGDDVFARLTAAVDARMGSTSGLAQEA